MTNQNNYIKLHATEKFVVGHIFETAYLTDIDSGQTTIIGDFYGDPSCGLISNDNKWCLVGGSSIKVWTENEVYEIKDDNLKWACKLRQIDSNKVEILIDPWADNSSVWEFNIKTKERKKIKDFDKYRDKEYTDEIEW
jgi:hypothetical protein